MQRITIILLSLFFITFLPWLTACDNRAGNDSVLVGKNKGEEKSALDAPPTKQPSFVGGKNCVVCHQAEATLWQSSHHDLAMQTANKSSVLGDFNNTKFYQTNAEGNKQLLAHFFKKSNQFWIEAQGADGLMHKYQVLYTFGVYPLQQYLIDYGQGQLQAFSVAWDSRERAVGGQRWFFLYDEPIAVDDPLHWTQFSQNWNRRCAACHSTDYKKGYIEQSQSYHPKWVDINVNCESCHGPGSTHIEWANNNKLAVMNKGFTVTLNSKNQWLRDDKQLVASRIAGQDNKQVEQCATCHSRRSELAKPVSGRFHDWLLLQTLEPNYYWPDGQVRDEVFVTGSFMQSKMYQAGVVCSDCHNPHSLQLKVEGDGLCLQCHSAEKYNTNTHHHHKGFKRGSACVDCHMPATTYMGVDHRRDHQFFIPNPNVTSATGAPNACNKCHTDESSQWVNKHLQQWGMPPDEVSEATDALSKAFAGNSAAVNQLLGVYQKSTTSYFLKASVLRLLKNYPGAFDPQPLIAKGLLSKSPIVRREAASLLEFLPPAERLQWSGVLDDDFYTVRYEALQAFADIPQMWENKSYKKVESEYLSAAKYHSDEPGTLANLAGYWQKKGQLKKAETYYKKALRLDADFYFALINMADLYRLTKEEDKAVLLLEKAIEIYPDNAQSYFALGLSYVRQKKKEQALGYLKKAVDIEQQEQYKAHYIYVYSVGLWDLGRRQQSIALLADAVKKYSYQPLVTQLAEYKRQMP